MSAAQKKKLKKKAKKKAGPGEGGDAAAADEEPAAAAGKKGGKKVRTIWLCAVRCVCIRVAIATTVPWTYCLLQQVKSQQQVQVRRMVRRGVHASTTPLLPCIYKHDVVMLFNNEEATLCPGCCMVARSTRMKVR